MGQRCFLLQKHMLSNHEDPSSNSQHLNYVQPIMPVIPGLRKQRQPFPLLLLIFCKNGLNFFIVAVYDLIVTFQVKQYHYVHKFGFIVLLLIYVVL